jgi:NTE family protein
MGSMNARPNGFEGSTIGVALGGGAVRGYAHLGVLTALDEAGYAPAVLAGTSAGALAAAMYAFGAPLPRMRRQLAELRWREISAPTLASGGLFSNRELGALVREELGEARIEDAPIPLAIVATDIVTGEKVVFRDGPVAEAVMASACIPGVYVPVEVGGRMLVDGALVEDVPISPLRKMGAEVVVGVHLCPVPFFQPPTNMLEVLINASYIAIGSSARLQLREADVVITPEVSRFNRVSTRQCPDLFDAGYAAGAQAVPEIQSCIERLRPHADGARGRG